MSDQAYTNSSSLLNNQENWLDGHNIFIRSDPSLIRNIFTTCFLVLNVLIALVGEYFLKRRNQRRLILRTGPGQKTVPFQLMTPWLSLTSLVTYIVKTRRLPGGFLGFLMLATGAFGLIQHYMVNSFVLPAPLPSWCDFTTGIITTANEIPIKPSPAWPAALLVFQAHTAVLMTKGERGIYDKINMDTTFFQPTVADILGDWTCNALADTAILPENWANETEVRAYINSQELISPATGSIGGSKRISDDTYTGFLAWSGSFNGSSDSWQVQVTIANNLDSSSSSAAAASNYNCTLTKHVATWNPTSMPANKTLAAWVDVMFGFIAQVPISHYQAQVETILNAMSMLAGSGNNNANHVSPGASTQYGCTVLGSQVHVAVYLVFVFLLLLFLIMLAADLYQLIRYRINKRRGLVEEFPTDLISWQLMMLRKLSNDSKLESKDLHQFSYMYVERPNGSGDFEFVKGGVVVTAKPTSRPNDVAIGAEGHPMQDLNPNLAARSTQTLLENGQYINVTQ